MARIARQGVSAATAASYATTWELFVDWCAATDHTQLPAAPDTVLAFLAGCPAAPATQRRRVIAIDHHHTAAGHPPPGDADPVRTTLGRPPKHPPPFQPPDPAAVDAALRLLPSHGWTAGMFGCRDRALLVLSQIAGVPYTHIATMTADHIVLSSGVATIGAGDRTRTVAAADDPVLCPVCALTRWLRVLQLGNQPGTRPVAHALAKAEPVTATSPHPCQPGGPVDPGLTGVPVLPPINQWGHLPWPLHRLSPHAASRHTRTLLTGHVTAHRRLPVDRPGLDDPLTAAGPEPVAAPVLPRYTSADRDVAWKRRRTDLAHLAELADDLADLEHRATELNHRVTELLAHATGRSATTEGIKPTPRSGFHPTATTDEHPGPTDAAPPPAAGGLVGNGTGPGHIPPVRRGLDAAATGTGMRGPARSPIERPAAEQSAEFA